MEHEVKRDGRSGETGMFSRQQAAGREKTEVGGQTSENSEL